jgi:cell division ATPase FtsA
MTKLINVLDLGSSKIAAATALFTRREGAKLQKLESLSSRGIEEGQIVDMNKAVQDVTSIMQRLETGKRKKIKKVWVTTRGNDIKLCLSRGMIPLAKNSREITDRDVKKCLSLASMIRLPCDRAIVQSVVKEFHIDGYPEKVKNPAGLYGMRLEVETHIATANLSKIQNITKCIDNSGFLLEGICLSGIASSESLLRKEEREKGVLLCDIGDGLTEAFIYKDGMLADSRLLQKGVRSISDRQGRKDPAKLSKLLKEVGGLLKDDSQKALSIVLAGGGSLVDGIIEEAEKVFGVPARIGLVGSAKYGLNSQDAVIHTSTIGLINRIADSYHNPYAQHKPFQRLLHKLLQVYESYF